MSSPFPSQILFFKKIKDKIGTGTTFVDEIAELLHVSTDSAYRRIRGETALTLEEAKCLSLKYDISLDELVRQSSTAITFNYSQVQQHASGFDQYYSNIYKSIQVIESGERKEIIYAAKDIPVFNLFHFPELAAFKIFFWMKNVVNMPGLEKKVFSPEEVNEKVLHLGKKILNTYIRIPTIELWNEETVNSTLKQLEYSFDSGLIRKKDDLFLLLNKMELLIQHIEQQAACGTKFAYGKEPVQEDGNFKLFINEILLSDNTIFVRKDNARFVYIPHNAINFLTTTNERFSEETEQWLANLQKRSSLISLVSEKDRSRFFRNIFEKIEKLRSSK